MRAPDRGRTRLRHGIIALDRRIGTFTAAVAAAMLAAAAGVGLFQVIARFVLAQPSTWSEVLTQTLITWMVFLGLPGAVRTGALLAVDVALRHSRRRVRRVLEALITLAGLGLFGIMAWYGYQMAWRVRFQVLAGLDVSIAWAYAAIPAGAAFALLAIAARALDPAPSAPDSEPAPALDSAP